MVKKIESPDSQSHFSKWMDTKIIDQGILIADWTWDFIGNEDWWKYERISTPTPAHTTYKKQIIFS